MPHDAARQAFPRGLVQPENGFRFGTDALLLASFAAQTVGNRVLDLGTGCGPVGLGLLLARNDTTTTVLGLDRQPDMVAAATANALLLGLDGRFTALVLDIRQLREHPAVGPETFDLVLANPPYRDPGTGRRPSDAGRDAARFETTGGLAEFAAATAYALTNKGSLACVYLAERLGHAMAVLAANNLEIKTLLPIAPRPGAPAGQVLFLARKNGNPGLRLEAPLCLYHGEGPDTRLSEAALRFCPFLSCNASPHAKR